MYRSLYPRDMFAELERLQREMQQAFDLSPSIRGIGRGGFPALNAGGTPQTVDIYAFAPGLDPATLDLNLDRGVLTIAGERKAVLPKQDEKTAVHINERFAGRFRRVVSLPEQDISLFDAVTAALSRRLGLPVWTFDQHFDVMRVKRWRPL